MINRIRTLNTTYYTYSYTGLLLGFAIWFLTSLAWLAICIFGGVRLGRLLAQSKHPYPLYQNGGALPRGNHESPSDNLSRNWGRAVRNSGSRV